MEENLTPFQKLIKNEKIESIKKHIFLKFRQKINFIYFLFEIICCILKEICGIHQKFKNICTAKALQSKYTPQDFSLREFFFRAAIILGIERSHFFWLKKVEDLIFNLSFSTFPQNS